MKMEKAGTGARQVPGKWFSLSQRRTGRLCGVVLGLHPMRWPCASTTKASHQRYTWGRSESVYSTFGSSVAGHRYVRRASKSAGEGDGREASGGTGGPLEAGLRATARESSAGG